LYGLRAVSPDVPPSAVYRRFDEMARRYVREVRTVQPIGPYLLLGECHGAGLAYEMAQQLRKDGEDVALLAIVDGFSPGGPELRRFIPRSAYHAADATRMLGFHLRTIRALGGPEKREYLKVRVARRLKRSTMSIRSHRDTPSPDVVRRDGFREALGEYQSAPYSGRVVLFRGKELPWGVECPAHLGWGDTVADLEVVELPAYFGTTILEPTVRLLADTLTQMMDGALARSSI
jgi:thioesterase domain-containing protein